MTKKPKQPRNWNAVNAKMRNCAGAMKDKDEKRLSNKKNSWEEDWEEEQQTSQEDSES